MSAKQDSREEYIRVLKFDGKKTDCRESSLKVKAVGKKKGWMKAMAGPLELFTLDPTDSSKKASGEQDTNENLNDAAWSYLLLACTSKSFNIVAGCKENTHKAWTKLDKRFACKEINTYVELQTPFTSGEHRTKQEIHQNGCWVTI